MSTTRLVSVIILAELLGARALGRLGRTDLYVWWVDGWRCVGTEMEILAALLTAQFGAAHVDTEQKLVLLQVRICLTLPDTCLTIMQPDSLATSCSMLHVLHCHDNLYRWHCRAATSYPYGYGQAVDPLNRVREACRSRSRGVVDQVDNKDVVVNYEALVNYEADPIVCSDATLQVIQLSVMLNHVSFTIHHLYSYHCSIIIYLLSIFTYQLYCACVSFWPN